MKTETLQLAGIVDEATAMNVARVLTTVNGVSKVAISTTSKSVAVDFDENVVSKRDLSAFLEQAGLGVKKAAHESGSCCGGCGG